MNFLIKTWLKRRTSLSNFLNRFDSFNKPEQNSLFFSNYDEAIRHLQEKIKSNYKYRYDIGDRLRTPNSVWNQTHQTGLLRDDCDGAAILAMNILHKAGYKNARLLTLVPVKSFWEGHTVCLFNDLDNKLHIIDYGTVSPAFNTFIEILQYFSRTRYVEYDHFVYSIDIFENNRWNNHRTDNFSK